MCTVCVHCAGLSVRSQEEKALKCSLPPHTESAVRMHQQLLVRAQETLKCQYESRGRNSDLIPARKHHSIHFLFFFPHKVRLEALPMYVGVHRDGF